MRARLPALLAAAALAAAALVPCMPLRRRLPGIDSGVFMYVASRVRRGELPYRDAWDSKPPLIYFLDAAGLAAAGGSEWGVWALQWLFLAAALRLSYDALERRVGGAPAALATGLWAAGLSEVLELGNFTEQYGLTLNFAVLWLAGREDIRPRRRAAWIGAATGLLFMLKQNLVALPAAWALARCWELRREPRRLLPELAVSAAAFAAAAGAFWLYFAARGAAGDLWDAAFVYNAVNSTPGWDAKWASAVAGFQVTWETLLPACGGLALLLARRDERLRGGFWLTCALALPLELAASSVTGRAFRHYYLAWLPAAAPLAAALAGAVWTLPRHRGAVIAGAVLLAASPVLRWRAQIEQILALPEGDGVVRYLAENTGPADSVLVWGVGAYNFASGRRSPTRYFMSHPLLRRGYAGPRLTARFMADLEKDPPAAIVDTSESLPDLPPLDAGRRARWPGGSYYAVDPSLEDALRSLESRYAPAARFPGEAIVWRPAPRPASPRARGPAAPSRSSR